MCKICFLFIFPKPPNKAKQKKSKHKIKIKKNTKALGQLTHVTWGSLSDGDSEGYYIRKSSAELELAHIYTELKDFFKAKDYFESAIENADYGGKLEKQIETRFGFATMLSTCMDDKIVDAIELLNDCKQLTEKLPESIEKTEQFNSYFLISIFFFAFFSFLSMKLCFLKSCFIFF